MFVTGTLHHCSDDTSLAAVLLIFLCFRSSNTVTDTAELVIFLSADISQRDLKRHSVNVFFLVFRNIFVNETNGTDQDMAILGVTLMRQTIRKQVAFIRLK